MVKIEMEMPKRCLDCPMMETVMDEYSYENTCDIIEHKQRKEYFGQSLNSMLTIGNALTGVHSLKLRNSQNDRIDPHHRRHHRRHDMTT